jgi:hypothetical protein
MLRNARVERRRRNIHEIFSHSKNNRGLTWRRNYVSTVFLEMKSFILKS